MELIEDTKLTDTPTEKPLGNWEEVTEGAPKPAQALGPSGGGMRTSGASGNPAAGAEQGQQEKPRLSFSGSRGFPQWLASTGGSLAFTTYQANKLFLIGVNQQTGRLSMYERSFPRCMGLGVGARGLWMSSVHTLWYFQNFLDPQQTHEGFDAIYVPLKGHTTGDIDIHDVHVRSDGSPIFIATRFNCLAELSPTASFQPVWTPPWIDRIAAEDRCHLNGLAVRDDKPAYVSAVAKCNVAGGWREQRRTGGLILDMETEEPVVTGLTMPHSPRLYRDKLWMIQSGTGEFGYVDLSEGAFKPMCFLQGFARGLAFFGDYAVIGVSRPRKDKTFEGLALSERLAEEGVGAKCYLAIVRLDTGDVEHTLEMEGAVQELYDVQLIPGIRRPQALGFRTDEIKYKIRPGRYRRPDA